MSVNFIHFANNFFHGLKHVQNFHNAKIYKTIIASYSSD
jgi:hypothetical protein